MKVTILSSLKKSIRTSFILLVFVLLLCLFSTDMREELLDQTLVMLVSFLMITFTAYIVSTYLKKKSIAIGLLISALLSFGFIYLLDFLVFDYLFFNGKEVNHSIKNFAIIGILISVLTYLSDSYKKSKIRVKPINVEYPLVNSLLYTGAVIIIYSVIAMITFEGDIWGNLVFIYQVLFSNAIVAFSLSMFLFNYIYKDYEKRKKLTYLYYVIVVVVFISFFLFKYNRIGAMNIQNFLSYLIVRVPFVFMIILSVQISYMLEFSKQEKKYLIQEKLASQLNFQQLKNQLSPHFLFNNINVLTSLIEENPANAVKFSENLSNIYRYFLEQEKEDIVTLKEELNFAETYLSLFKGRFEKGIEYKVERIDDNEYCVISTSLQQILENVVKHNVIDEEHPIKISVQIEADYLVITNNCNPKKEVEISSKKGLKNIQERYAFFTDKKVYISHKEEKFTIKLPLLLVAK